MDCFGATLEYFVENLPVNEFCREIPQKVGIRENTVADPGGPKVAIPPPRPVKNSHKKMAAVRNGLYFMFLTPPSEVSGFATEIFRKNYKGADSTEYFNRPTVSKLHRYVQLLARIKYWIVFNSLVYVL